MAADIILRRKAIGLEVAVTQRAALLSGRYPHLEPQIREWTTWRTQLATKTLSGPAENESPEDHKQALNEWSTRLDRLERELASQIPELGMDDRLRNVDRHVVASALPERAVLVEFLRFNTLSFPVAGGETWKPAQYVAFVLEAGRGDEVRMVDLGDAEPIETMVRTFRLAVQQEGATRKLESMPQQPREALWEIAERLRVAVFDKLFEPEWNEPPANGSGRYRRLFLATDGELNLLPFEALRTPDGRYLTDEYEISYLGTGRDLLRSEASVVVEAEEPVVAADPAFALARTANSSAGNGSEFRGEMEREGIRFSPLPGTRLEGERVSWRLRVVPWVAEQVLKRKVKQLRCPWVLHTATHGYFLSDGDHLRAEFRQLRGTNRKSFERLSGEGLQNPMLRSGLALAGSQNWLERQPVPEEAGDGLLTAEDVATMDLRGTALAVLSACNTGMGQTRHGEGVFGLRRGFLLAGVKTLVMSLWKVDDLAAVLLMDRFYENLLDRKMGRCEALREAQRFLRRDVTVGGIRQEWLNEEMIAKLAVGNAEARERLKKWRDSPDDARPFREVFYWAPFILHGETGPLDSSRGRER
jgi:CHAT domain-containing protein